MTDNPENLETQCGSVSIIGAPNVGKSTLVNALVGEKVSIVSPKVQTTRMTVRGIALADQAQIILLDTPGIFAAKETFEKSMVKAAWQSLSDADCIMVLIDASKGHVDRATQDVLASLKEQKLAVPLCLVINKIDKSRHEDLLKLAAELNDEFDFDATFMISAQKGHGVDDILSYLQSKMPFSEWIYPEDYITDMPMRLLAAEITREKLFLRIHQELPYGLMVETEGWEEKDDGSVLVNQVIHVAKDSHRPIILGKGGQTIKEIGQKSREDIGEILGCKVHLKLFVKVTERWKEDPHLQKMWGLPDVS